MKDYSEEVQKSDTNSEAHEKNEDRNKGNCEDGITCKMLESAEVAINVCVHLERPLIGKSIKWENFVPILSFIFTIYRIHDLQLYCI